MFGSLLKTHSMRKDIGILVLHFMFGKLLRGLYAPLASSSGSVSSRISPDVNCTRFFTFVERWVVLGLV